MVSLSRLRSGSLRITVTGWPNRYVLESNPTEPEWVGASVLVETSMLVPTVAIS